MDEFRTWSINDLEKERERYRGYLSMALREGLPQAESWAKHLDRLSLEIQARCNKNIY